MMMLVLIGLLAFLHLYFYTNSIFQEHLKHTSRTTLVHQATVRGALKESDLNPVVVVKPKPPTRLEDANCLAFKCSNDTVKCDNALSTNYDGTEPPCCVHVLRDMSQIFDESMQKLGLDYSVGFGTLLGLIRSDRLIPWTGDNDYILPSKDVATTMVEQWPNTTGLAHILQGINRICVTPDFAGGKLQNWTVPPPPYPVGSPQLWEQGYPYIDLYAGRNITGNLFQEIDGCSHLYSDIFPTKRTWVYNNTFAHNFPANPEQLLRTYYGKDWRIPSEKKKAHGGALCPYSPFEKEFRHSNGDDSYAGSIPPGPMRTTHSSLIYDISVVVVVVFVLYSRHS